MFRAAPISAEIFLIYQNNTNNTGQINVNPPYSFSNYGIGQPFNESYYAVIDKYFQVIRTDSKSVLEAKQILQLDKNNNATEGRINYLFKELLILRNLLL